MNKQKTISKSITFQGIGLHTGRLIRIILNPGDNGLEFKTHKESKFYRIEPNSVINTQNNTSVKVGDSTIKTIEHLMFAFKVCGIDNIRCEVYGNEIPVMDGSSRPFIYILEEAGFKSLDKEKEIIEIQQNILVNNKDSFIEFSPSDEFQLEVSINFPHPRIGSQKCIISQDDFLNISRARTFGFLNEANLLKRQGLIKGASMSNAIILDDYKVINPEGLRGAKELVWHKALDLLGDLHLTGKEIKGHIKAYKPSHEINNLFARKLML